MPEGDNLARIADTLAPTLIGQEIRSARGRPGGAQLERVVGSRATAVESRGKHLLIAFDAGLTLHTHLGLHGSWHRYRPGQRWRRSPARAVAVLQTDTAVCACFDAPTVELLDSRAVRLHPALAGLGPDVAAGDFDPREALERLRHPRHRDRPLGEALLDQPVVAGLGNVYRSELCFLERLDPFVEVGAVSDEALLRLLERGARLVAASRRSGRRVTTSPGTAGDLYVYGRTGRPCRRCATPIGSVVTGQPPRRVYWCPSCQSIHVDRR